MKQLSKYIQLGITGTIILTISSGLAVSAQVKRPPEKSRDSAFCTNLAANISKVDTGIANAKAKFMTTRTASDQSRVNNHAKWDEQLAADRAKWDRERQDNFTKLEARAKTETQASAIKAYEAAIIAAITTKRSADDAARATFRTSVNATLIAQRSTRDSQLAAFSSSVSSAEATALAGCQATPSSGQNLRAAFRNSLKSARETYTSERKGDENTLSQIKQFAATRNASFKANELALKTAVAQARDALKAAFGNNA